MNSIRLICDCPTQDALICRENPDCQPSYCKMKFLRQARFEHDIMQPLEDGPLLPESLPVPATHTATVSPRAPELEASAVAERGSGP